LNGQWMGDASAFHAFVRTVAARPAARAGRTPYRLCRRCRQKRHRARMDAALESDTVRARRHAVRAVATLRLRFSPRHHTIRRGWKRACRQETRLLPPTMAHLKPSGLPSLFWRAFHNPPAASSLRALPLHQHTIRLPALSNWHLPAPLTSTHLTYRCPFCGSDVYTNALFIMTRYRFDGDGKSAMAKRCKQLYRWAKRVAARGRAGVNGGKTSLIDARKKINARDNIIHMRHGRRRLPLLAVQHFLMRWRRA